MRGFSSRNLWNMKDFFLSYKDNQKLQTLSAEISWSHNIAILSQCKDPLEKEFYMRMAKRNGWSFRVLIHQIDNGTYEKTICSQSNFEKNLPTNLYPEAKLAVKDDYAFDFLEIGEKHTEYELERAIVKNKEKIHLLESSFAKANRESLIGLKTFERSLPGQKFSPVSIV